MRLVRAAQSTSKRKSTSSKVKKTSSKDISIKGMVKDEEPPSTPGAPDQEGSVHGGQEGSVHGGQEGSKRRNTGESSPDDVRIETKVTIRSLETTI
eukprot:344306-Prorocentrum_minimum.AAC.1